MEHIKLIDTEHCDEPRVLALVSVANEDTLQIQIEQDGGDAYIDIYLEEAILLRDKLNEFISEKE